MRLTSIEVTESSSSTDGVVSVSSHTSHVSSWSLEHLETIVLIESSSSYATSSARCLTAATIPLIVLLLTLANHVPSVESCLLTTMVLSNLDIQSSVSSRQFVSVQLVHGSVSLGLLAVSDEGDALVLACLILQQLLGQNVSVRSKQAVQV